MTLAGTIAALISWCEDAPGFVGWVVSARGKPLAVTEEQESLRPDAQPILLFRHVKHRKDGSAHRWPIGNAKPAELVHGTWPIRLHWKRAQPVGSRSALVPHDWVSQDAFPELLVQRDAWLERRAL